jgi:hydrogenase expression/formation protein HypC
MCLGIPGQVVEIIDKENFIAKVDVSGVKRNISVALLDLNDLLPGDWVLIHVGFAMSKIDEEEAQETLKLMRELENALDDEMKLYRQSAIE